MKEVLTEGQEVQRTKERLEAILDKGYVVEESYSNHRATVYRITEVQEKTMFRGIRSRIKKTIVAEVLWLEQKYKLIVYDEAVYPMMKQFGNECGYRELEKGWEGADIEREPPQEKMKETVSESLDPRYKQMTEDR
jgi:hypothetical protein